MINNIINIYISSSFYRKCLIFISFFVLFVVFYYYFFLIPILKYKDNSISHLASVSNALLEISTKGEEIFYLKSLLPDSEKFNKNINIAFKEKADDQGINFEVISEHINEICINIMSVDFNKLLVLLIDLESNYGIIVHKVNIIKDVKINGNVIVNSLLLTRYSLEDYFNTIKYGNSHD